MGDILIDGQAALLREKNRNLRRMHVVGIGNEEMYRRLSARVSEAEKKHPDFADGIYQGVGVIGEEYGELCQALNKNQGEERVMDEALDLLCVAWRFCRGDWEKSRQE
jgi:hypothetical protein